MLFHSLYEGHSGVYFEQTSWMLRGPLDQAAFGRAWQQVIDRHSALRTSFVWEELDEPVQVVHRQVTVPLTFEDWRGLNPEAQAARLEAFMAADRAQGFDLLAPPLMRLALLQVDDQTHHFIWSHHHLLLDGWSQPVLFGEYLRCTRCARGRTAAASPRPYRDYIAWLQEQDRSAAERIGGAPGRIRCPHSSCRSCRPAAPGTNRLPDSQRCPGRADDDRAANPCAAAP